MRLMQHGRDRDTVERICREARRLPEDLAREVLDFIGYLEQRHGLRDVVAEDLAGAQEPAMRHVWESPEDDVWNDL